MPPKAAIIPEIGHSGVLLVAGRPNDEKIPELQGDRKFQVFREMSSNDATVSAMLFAFDTLMRHRDFYIRPYSKSNIDKSRATFLEECFYDMSHSIAAFVGEVMTMLIYGFDFEEICYKFRQNDGTPDSPSKHNDGRIGWKKFARRPQWTRRRWIFDEQGGTQAFVQEPPFFGSFDGGSAERTIPMIKGMLFRTREEAGNPEGKSALRGSFRAWWIKKRFENLEGVGAERDLAGIPLMRAPSRIFADSATPADKAILADLADMVSKIRNDDQAGIILPSEYNDQGKPLYDFSLVSASGGKQFDTGAIIDRWDQRIAMTLMADVLLMGSKKSGSFALGSAKEATLKDAINSWGFDIADVLNNFAIPRLFALNGYDLGRLPRAEFGEVKNIDVRALGDLMARLFGAGVQMFPDTELEGYVRDVAGMPKPTEGQGPWKQVMAPQAQPGDTPGNTPSGQPKGAPGNRSPQTQRTGRGAQTGSSSK